MHRRDYLFSFHGRATRAQWWLFVLIFFVFSFLEFLACFYLLGFLNGFFAGWILMLLLIWPALAVGERRLHDRGRRGVWLLLFYLGPLILGAVKLWLYGDTGISAITHPSGLSTVLSLGEFVLIVWAIIELGILRGTVGDNKYGPDALAHAPPKS
jgi:uncharacterized membrane protein YhaH (DUF805 family)